MLDAMISQFWLMSWQAAIVALLVLLLQLVFRRLLTPRWRHTLWLLVLVRLLIPVLPASPLSVFSWFHSAQHQEPIAAPLLVPANHTVISIHYDSFAEPPIDTHPVSVHAVPFWSTTRVIALVWLIGAISLALRLIVINLRFHHKLKPSAAVSDDLQLILQNSQPQMKVSCIRLLITDAVTSPAVAGLFRPKILLPTAMAGSLNDAQLRLIFLHELAHVKSQDVAMDWAWAIAQSLHWFNPVVWLIAPLRRADREQARDAMVLQIAGRQSANAYGQTLLDLSRSSEPILFCPGLVGILGGKRRLHRRIKSIADFRERSNKSALAGVALLLVTGCSFLTNPAAPQGRLDSHAAKALASASTRDAGISSNETTRAMVVPDNNADVETCSYDINDLLFLPTNSYLDQPSKSYTPNEMNQLRLARIEDVKTFVRDNVAASGSTIGKIESDSVKHLIIVTDTHQHQLAIQEALDDLKKSRGGVSSIETRFFSFTDADFENLPVNIRRRFAALSGAGRYRTDQIISADEKAQIVQAVQKNQDSLSLTTPRLTLFEGQHGSIRVAEQQAYVDSLTPISAKKPNGEVAALYEPHVSTIAKLGVDESYTVRHAPAPDQQIIFADVSVRVSRLLALIPITENWPDPRVKINATWQLPVTVTYQRTTACAIPEGSMLLLGLDQEFELENAASTQPTQIVSVDHVIEQEKRKHVFLLITPKTLPGHSAQKPPQG